MTDWYLNYVLDLPGGCVSAAFEANGVASVRASAPFQGVDHVGFYRAGLPRERVAALRERYAQSGYVKAPAPGGYGPDTPTVSFGEGQGSEDPQAFRTFPLPSAGEDVRRLSAAASQVVLDALQSPLAALRAHGRMESVRLSPEGRLAFRATFESIGEQPARWPQPLVALAAGRARVSLQVSESGQDRGQGVTLDPSGLSLADPDGAPAPAVPVLVLPRGASFVLAGSVSTYLEPARYRARLTVQLAEPQDAGETDVYGIWEIDLGSFEVKR